MSDDVIAALTKERDEAEREIARLREALESVQCGYSESERPKSCNAECVARAALREARQ